MRLQGPKHLDLHGRPSSVPLHQRAADGGVQHCCTGDENELLLEVNYIKYGKKVFDLIALLKVWKLSSCDMCELARNSVVTSGFSHEVGIRLVNN